MQIESVSAATEFHDDVTEIKIESFRFAQSYDNQLNDRLKYCVFFSPGSVVVSFLLRYASPHDARNLQAHLRDGFRVTSRVRFSRGEWVTELGGLRIADDWSFYGWTESSLAEDISQL